MADRKVLTQISSTAWEHAADRAALNSLRAIPGFDEVVRKIAGFFGEKGVRQLFLANAVLVGPKQRPALHDLYSEVLETLDWPERPELYVSQTPFVNAAAVGFDKPFIVLNSATIALLEKEERRDILGHEMGHIISGHTTYTTIAIIIRLTVQLPPMKLRTPAFSAASITGRLTGSRMITVSGAIRSAEAASIQ